MGEIETIGESFRREINTSRSKGKKSEQMIPLERKTESLLPTTIEGQTPGKRRQGHQHTSLT